MAGARRHRCLRFSLRTMFVVVTALAFGLVWLGWQTRIVARRTRALKEEICIKTYGPLEWLASPPGDVWLGSPKPFRYKQIYIRNSSTRPNFARIAVGDREISAIIIDCESDPSRDANLNELFPEADIYSWDAVRDPNVDPG